MFALRPLSPDRRLRPCGPSTADPSMPRILFVHNKLTRFVQDDRDLLAERYSVTEWEETSPKGIRPANILRAVRKHDLIFAWFASWHSLLPVLAARRLGK